ncbi:MAG: hypothetical protein GX620_03465 [Chloroflexi bacterium]|nr:hypothetical protein [Chloroflexota bacterium]
MQHYIEVRGRARPVRSALPYSGIIAVLCLSALFLYFLRLDIAPLWWDEGISIETAGLALPDLIRTTVTDDVHPPGYYLLLHYWMRLTGSSPFSVRALSALAGVLLVPLLYASGRRLGGQRTGCAAGLLGTIAPFAVHYAREARMYSLGIALAALSTYAYLRILYGARDRRVWWMAYVMGSVVGLHIQYMYSVLVVTQIISAILLDRRRVRQWGLSAVLILAFLIPWTLYARAQVSGLQSDRLGAWDWRTTGEQAWRATQYLVNGLATVDTVRTSGTAVVALLLALIGLGALFRRQAAVAVTLLLGILGAIAVVLLVEYQPGEDILRGVRLAFAGLPLLLLLMGQGVTWLGSRRVGIGASLVILLIGSAARGIVAAYYAPIDADEDYRPLVAQIEAMARPDDAVFAVYAWQRGYFASYAPDAGLAIYGDWPASMSGSEFVAELLASHERLWIVNYRADVQGGNAPFHSWLDQHAALAYDEWFGDTHLALFLSGDDPPEAWTEQVALEDGTTLAYEPLSTTVHGGDVVQFSIRWRFDEAIGSWHRVLVHLGWPGVEPVAQNDLALDVDWLDQNERSTGKGVIQRHVLLLPDDVPPGEYQLYVGLYDSRDDERLAVVDPSTDDRPGRVCIGRVRVIPKL